MRCCDKIKLVLENSVECVVGSGKNGDRTWARGLAGYVWLNTGTSETPGKGK